MIYINEERELQYMQGWTFLPAIMHKVILARKETTHLPDLDQLFKTSSQVRATR